jgi:phosphoglycolate phosphatase-like HAD superfamily hydrolase
LSGNGQRARRLPADVPWALANTFEKRDLMEWIVARGECRGDELLCCGDGVTEILAVKAAGGLALGVATDEPECAVVEPGKRERLIAAGADWIAPNYLSLDGLRQELWSR